MYLVDSSVWTHHFRQSNEALVEALNKDLVVCHPFIVGELALGSLQDRQTIIAMLKNLPATVVADNDEILHLIETRQLYSRGLGLIDAHLLGSVLIEGGGLRIWTADKRFAVIADEFEVGTGTQAK